MVVPAPWVVKTPDAASIVATEVFELDHDPPEDPVEEKVVVVGAVQVLGDAEIVPADLTVIVTGSVDATEPSEHVATLI